jgi:hypothetical protein
MPRKIIRRESTGIMGRPTEYKPEYCEIVKRMYQEGKTNKQIYAFLDISHNCFHEWRKSYADFDETVKKYTDHSEAWWINLGLVNITNKDFNARLYALMMQNLHGWNRKIEVGITVKHEDAIKELE